MKKVIVIFICLGLFGCSDDFLDRESLSDASVESFFKTKDDAQLVLNGMYASLQNTSLYGGNLSEVLGLPLYDNFGDNSFNNFKWEGAGIFMEGTLDPSHFSVQGRFNPHYNVIGRANFAIQGINEIPEDGIDEETRNNYLGQALFVRSLMYFNLAVYWEDVPLITELQEIDEVFVPKSTVEEIFEQIKADLKTAAENLPEAHPANLYGYATKGAALGLLARIQLYEKDYAGVLTTTSELLTLGYALNPDYASLFTPAAEFSDEIIFSVRFLEGAESNNGETFTATFNGTPKGDSRPMPNLVNDYYNRITGLPEANNAALPASERDPRLNATIYFDGDVFLQDDTDPKTFNAGSSPTGFAHKKYLRTNLLSEGGFGAFVQNGGTQDFCVIRYADVLLMRAEAMVETNDLNGARALVNQIRIRAGMPTVDAVEGTGLSQGEMRSLVRHERRVELALEGLRFMDLKRWGQIEEAFIRATADNVSGYNPVYRGERSEVSPLPQQELDVNPLLEQHPAWQ